MDADEIVVLPAFLGVQARPTMYWSNYGTVEFADDAIRFAVTDALAGEPDRVGVYLDNERQFTIEDDGPGLPGVAGPANRKSVAELISESFVGRGPTQRGIGLVHLAALCRRVYATTWHDGREFDIHWDVRNEPHPITHEVGETDRHGSRLTFVLASGRIPSTVELDLPANVHLIDRRPTRAV